MAPALFEMAFSAFAKSSSVICMRHFRPKLEHGASLDRAGGGRGHCEDS